MRKFLLIILIIPWFVQGYERGPETCNNLSEVLTYRWGDFMVKSLAEKEKKVGIALWYESPNLSTTIVVDLVSLIGHLYRQSRLSPFTDSIYLGCYNDSIEIHYEYAITPKNGGNFTLWWESFIEEIADRRAKEPDFDKLMERLEKTNKKSEWMAEQGLKAMFENNWIKRCNL